MQKQATSLDDAIHSSSQALYQVNVRPALVNKNELYLTALSETLDLRNKQLLFSYMCFGYNSDITGKDINNMEIGKVISDIRSQHNLSQDEMAEKLFVTRQAVSRWEKSETTPSIDTLKLISKEFNVPANVLLGIQEGAICQSCGMDLNKIDDFGTNDTDEVHTDYCTYCMSKGSFTNERTLDEMVESNLRYLDEYNKEKGLSFTPDEARVELKKHLATLKRWRDHQ